MLHAIVPIAAIFAAIGVCVGAFSMFLVVAIMTFISATVLPHVDTMSMHHAILERALEVATIGPLKAPVAAHLVLAPHTSVLGAIGPKVAAFTLFDAQSEHAMVVAAVGPDFDTFAIAFVLLVHHVHLIRVLRQIISLILTEYAQVRQCVILPVAFVCLAAGLGCPEDSHRDSLAVDPVSFEVGAIGPDKLAVAAPRVLVIDDCLACGGMASW